MQVQAIRRFSPFYLPAAETGGWSPRSDVFENEDRFMIVVELPGVAVEDVEITIRDGILTLNGDRPFYADVDRESFHRVERHFGAFSRKVRLPRHADADRISAEMVDGVLRIEAPRSEATKARTVEVRVPRLIDGSNGT